MVLCLIFKIIFPGHVQCIEGIWIEGVSAGGSRNDLEMFATNPQYILTLSEPGELL